MRRSLFLVVLLFLAASAAYAQDPAKVDPKHCKVEFENAQVRVLHWTTGPHEKSPMHEHPAFVSISLTDNDTRFTLPDGTTNESHSKAGETSWNAGGKHSSESLNDKQTEVIQVELKVKPHVAAKATKKQGGQ
jgi:hypothetical protein